MGIQEAKENLIRLPEDPPAAVGALVMWLYGFALKDCHTGMNSHTTFKDNYVFYTELYALAAKYDVSQLKLDVESLFKSHCNSYAAYAIRQSQMLSWYFPLLRHLVDNHEAAPPLRDIALTSFRSGAYRLWDMSEQNKTKFWKDMQDWPELAFHLLATGGLDGKACKIFAEGKVPPLVVPTPVAEMPDEEATPVITATETAAATPKKVTPRLRKVTVGR